MKLDLKEWINKVSKWFAIETTSSVSDFITMASGWTCSYLSVKKLGSIVFFEMVIQKSGGLVVSAPTVCGTLKTNYVPILSGVVTGGLFTGFAYTNGELYVTNNGTTTLSNAQRICGVMLVGGGST